VVLKMTKKRLMKRELEMMMKDLDLRVDLMDHHGSLMGKKNLRRLVEVDI